VEGLSEADPQGSRASVAAAKEMYMSASGAIGGGRAYHVPVTGVGAHERRFETTPNPKVAANGERNRDLTGNVRPPSAAITIIATVAAGARLCLALCYAPVIGTDGPVEASHHIVGGVPAKEIFERRLRFGDDVPS